MKYVIRRIIIILLVMTILLPVQFTCAEGVLPSWSDLLGIKMPSLGEALQRYPDGETVNEDGSITYLYQGISKEDYETFNGYLEQHGVELADSKFEGGVLTAALRANDADFSFVYDIKSSEAKVTYPDGTYDQWTSNAENHFTAAEELQGKGNTNEAAMEILSIPQYMTYAPLKEFLQNNKDLAAAVAAREEKIATYRTPGGIVTFGRYEQDNNLKNDKEPIEWIVLDYDIRENKSLLISKYGLEAERYSFKGEDIAEISWESSFLRSWLNEDFQKSAFSAEEIEAVLLSEVDNSSSQGFSKWKTDGGNNTKDRIFLLSYAEASQYFGNFGTTLSETNMDLIISLTPYVASSENYRHCMHKTGDGKEAIVWWLRSPGHRQDLAATVFSAWLADVAVDDVTCIVRPAFWLDLNADIF